MASQKYTYSISTDFPNHKVATDRLLQEIRLSSIVTASDYINSSGDDCDIWFKDTLSSGDKTILDGLIAVHSGEPLPDSVMPVSIQGNPTLNGMLITTSDAPHEGDRKPVMVNSPATEGTFTWLSSRGDDLNPTPPASGRGDGTQLFLSFTEPDTKEVEIQFCEPIELHDGHVSWQGDWGFEDSWNVAVRMPATVATENVGNTGNCNLVATGLGFNVVVPAVGDGAYDIDYAQAVPIPDGYSTKTGEGTGYWDVVQHWSEDITPHADGKGEYNFYDVALEMFFCKNMDCGSNLKIWDLDAYKAEWVSKKWKVCFSATRATSGAGKIGGYLMIFRPGAI